MKTITGSLSVKLVGLLLMVVLVGSGVTLFMVTRITRHQFLSYVQESDRARARELALVLEAFHQDRGTFDGVRELLRPPTRLPGRDASREAMTRRMREMHGSPMPMMYHAMSPERIVLVDSRGQVIADSFPGDRSGTAGIRLSQDQGVPVESGGSVVARVMVGSMIDSAFSPRQELFLGALRRAILLSTVVVSAVALVFGSAFLSGITRPLRELSAAAHSIAEGNLSVSVPHAGKDEIGELARSFRSMRDSLDQANTERDRLFRDIAHELRTPVTLLRGEVEAMLDGVYEVSPDALRSLLEEIRILDTLVSDVRLVSALDSRETPLERAPVKIEMLLDHVRHAFTRQAEAVGAKILTSVDSTVGSGSVIVHADQGRLAQVLSNLVANALRHGAPREIVLAAHVRKDPAADRDTVEITVRDDGPGIPAGETEAIFGRLYRGDRARSRGGSGAGSGLGLSIARRIVEAHGGTLTAENVSGRERTAPGPVAPGPAAPGPAATGAVFILRLPVASPSDPMPDLP